MGGIMRETERAWISGLKVFWEVNWIKGLPKGKRILTTLRKPDAAE
jgi:hypothetical protein